jgi:uncharacterized protein involved in type VI secretion and phage assembly
MPAGKTDRDNGIVIGIADDLDDPEKLGRVRVKLPHLDGAPSDWAWLVSQMAGKGRGLFLRPEKGDQVLVAYLQGDPSYPYILGSLWSKEDPPPADDGDAVANNCRFLHSRSGHIVMCDDTKGAERIEVVDQSGKLKVILDSAGQTIQVSNDGGNIEVTSSMGDVTVSASAGTITLKGLKVEVTAEASMSLKCSGPITIQGSLVQIN